MTMIVFTFVFDKVAKLPTEGIPYPVFSFTGLLPWGLFATALNQGSRSLVMHNNMVTKIYFPRLILPMSAVFAGLVDFFISFIILIGLMVYYKVTPAWGQLWTLPLFLLLALTPPLFLAALVGSRFAVYDGGAGADGHIARWREQIAQQQRDRAEKTLATATRTANDMVFKLAQDFRDETGMPLHLMRRILDSAGAP